MAGQRWSRAGPPAVGAAEEAKRSPRQLFSLASSMPADLLVGRSARRVAAYVSRVSRGRRR